MDSSLRLGCELFSMWEVVVKVEAVAEVSAVPLCLAVAVLDTSKAELVEAVWRGGRSLEVSVQLAWFPR